MIAPRRRQPIYDDDEALEKIAVIIGESWPEFKTLKPCPLCPSGWRNPTKDERWEQWTANKRADEANAKAAARDGNIRPLISMQCEGDYDLSEEARQLIDQWLDRCKAKDKAGRPELHNKRNPLHDRSRTVAARYYFDVIKVSLQEYYPAVVSKDLHTWTYKLTAKLFNIDERGLRSGKQRKLDPKLIIDLKRFRAHLRWLRYTEQRRWDFDEQCPHIMEGDSAQ
jgi:hypothetical protein